MAQEINLLPQLTEKEVSREVYKKKVNVSAIAALLGVVVILLGLFSYQLFLQTSRTRVDREAKNIEDQIQQQQTKEISQRALVDKLNQIEKLLNEAPPVSSAVANVLKLSKEGNISLSQVSVKSDGDVQVAGTSTTSTLLGKFFKALADVDEKIFAKINLSNLSKEAGEPYQFTIDMDFQLKGLIPKNEAF